MDFSFRFDGWWRGLPPSPTDEGRVVALILRPRGAAAGTRERADAVQVSGEGGVAGDRWVEKDNRVTGAQVSLVNTHVVESLAGDETQTLAFGDNLQVDLCLSEENLPLGTRLYIGSAVLEVSGVPHRPCRKFVQRLGATAAKKVARADRLGKRGRGLMTAVVKDGEIQVGDAIRVERPSA